jgi:hypothetical protein
MSKRSTLHLKPKPAPSEASAIQKLASVIDGMGQHAPSPNSGDALRLENNRGKILHAAFADQPELLGKLLAVAQEGGCSVTASPSTEFQISLKLIARRSDTISPDVPCSTCGGPRDRSGQYQCRACHNNDERERCARKQARLRKMERLLANSGLNLD